MAPKYPDEVDVFTVPHNRMKALVQQYHELFTLTNFSSACEVMQLLEQLGTTFYEFKVHESIENKYIMQKLRWKMQQLSITNKVVCNCHKDHKLSQMLQLLQDGHSKCSKTDQDRLNYGIKLRMALDDFTEQFIPHMREEEEVLQPLLVEHFSYEELKEIKSQVIHHHTQIKKRKDSGEEFYQDVLLDEVFNNAEPEDDDDDDEEEVEEEGKEICEEKDGNDSFEQQQQLPDEVWLYIFSFLNPLDLMHCSMMSKHWNRLSMDPSLWTTLNPIAWDKGNWTFVVDDYLYEEEAVPALCPGAFLQIDEDADIDESAEGFNTYCASNKYHSETKLMTSMIENFMVRVGRGVQKISLTYSHGITDDLLRKLLSLCPNVEHLDISQTKISDKAFKSLGENGCGKRLRHLNLTGCVNITDKTLKKLSEAVASPISNRKSYSMLKLLAPVDLESCTFMSLCAGMQSKSGRKFPRFDNDIDLLPECCVGCNYLFSCPLSTAVYGSVGINNRDYLRQISRTSNSTKVEKNQDVVMSCCDFLQCDRTLLCKSQSFDDMVENNKNRPPKPGQQSGGIEYLNLSGCYHITDEGLRALSRFGGLPKLTYLDLSGCLNVSGKALEQLVESCPKLEHEFLFYCDNIANDPYEYTASGCQNLQCGSRVCCRTGE